MTRRPTESGAAAPTTDRDGALDNVEATDDAVEAWVDAHPDIDRIRIGLTNAYRAGLRGDANPVRWRQALPATVTRMREAYVAGLERRRRILGEPEPANDCDLCGQPVKVGNVHKACADYEQFSADQS